MAGMPPSLKVIWGQCFDLGIDSVVYTLSWQGFLTTVEKSPCPFCVCVCLSVCHGAVWTQNSFTVTVPLKIFHVESPDSDIWWLVIPFCLFRIRQCCVRCRGCPWRWMSWSRCASLPWTPLWTGWSYSRARRVLPRVPLSWCLSSRSVTASPSGGCQSL